MTDNSTLEQKVYTRKPRGDFSHAQKRALSSLQKFLQRRAETCNWLFAEFATSYGEVIRSVVDELGTDLTRIAYIDFYPNERQKVENNTPQPKYEMAIGVVDSLIEMEYARIFGYNRLCDAKESNRKDVSKLLPEIFSDYTKKIVQKPAYLA